MDAEAVEDLRWLLLSPSLLRSDAEYPCEHVAFDGAARDKVDGWLTTLAADPRPLRAFLDDQRPPREVPMRLGRYAERLLAFYLTHGPMHTLVAANLAVLHAPGQPPGAARDHTTKGEIDFLVADQHGRRLHWELAIKYFVARDLPSPTIDDYIGPDGSESFRRKVEKLVWRQVVQPPPAPHDAHAWAPQLFTRGRMFYRLGRDVTPCSVLAADHVRGFWLPITALDELRHRPTSHAFVVVPRAQWIAPRVHHNVLSIPQLRAEVLRLWQIAAASRPDVPRAGVMIAEVAPAPASSPDAAAWHELARGFVMPDD